MSGRVAVGTGAASSDPEASRIFGTFSAPTIPFSTQ
jgi:hypothetical protein